MLRSVFSSAPHGRDMAYSLRFCVASFFCSQQITKESKDVEARSETVRKDEAVANGQAEESRALKEEVSCGLHAVYT